MNYAVAKNNGYSIKKDNTKNLFHIELLDEQQKPVNLTGTSIKILGTTNKQSVIINKLVQIEDPKWVNKAFTLERKKLILKMGNWEGKRQSGLQLKLPKVSLGQVKDVELVFDRRWYVCLSYENGLQIEEQKQGVTTSIDPGEIHSIASVNENGDSLVVIGRYIRSIHRMRNKKGKEKNFKNS